MTWGDDHHGKTHYGRWENALLDAYQGDNQDDDEKHMSTTRDPDTDQPAPLPADGAASAHDAVIARLTARANRWPAWVGPTAAALVEERKALGLRKYGVVLHPDNGRDHWRDVLEELADAAAYAECVGDTWLTYEMEAILLDVIEARGKIG